MMRLRDSVCAEKQLLASCARTRMVPEIAEQIREVTAGPLDWDFVLAEATENSVGPLLDLNLRAVVPESVPAGVMERLKITCRANTVRCLFLAAELHKILDLFRAAGIVAIPYKGPVLAEQAYGNLTLRDFDDLDMIVPQRDLMKAHEVMLGLGYQARFPWILSKDSRTALVPGEYNYRDEKRRAVVELHTELTLRHFPVVPDIDRFAQRLVKVMVAGREVLTFAREDLLSALCVHGSKDFWERISWVADVAELIQGHADLDWDLAFRTAESLRVERMVHLGLALADDLLQAPMPSEIRKRVREDGEAVSVAREVEQRTLSRDLADAGTGSRLRFRRRMVQGTLAGWRYSFRLAMVPAEEDWEMVQLPGALAPLYLALRPLRLLHKYGWTRRRQDASM
ncbi:MAG: nucleotidyltransferase family protein [Candidatus Acidiferrales bacterium]